MNPRVRLKHRLEALGLRILSFPLGPIGWRGTQRVGAFLGGAGYSVVRLRRRVTRENLRRAFGPGASERELDRIARAAYRQWGTTFLELARFGVMGPGDVRRIVTIDRPSLFDDMRREGRGALLFTGHFGNFDLLAASVAASGYPLSVLVQHQSNPIVDRRVTGYRERMGERVIARGAGVREILRALRRNEFVAIVGDQDARAAGVFVDFLGAPASTPKGPALLAYRSGAPILFCVLERQADGMHLARFDDPLRARPDAPEEEEVLRLTGELARKLEAAVRRRPDHYFWPHRRWKTRPPSQEESP